MKKIGMLSVVVLLWINAAWASSCDSFNMAAQDESQTIDKRLEAAKRYKACLINESVRSPQEMLMVKSAPPVEQANSQIQDLSGKQKFLGQNFGIGFGVSFYNGEIVDDADVVNGIVVAKSRKREEARVLLEFHSLIACNKGGTTADFGCGPFAAIAAKDNDVLGGVGLGWLWSWRNKSANDGSGFSIGVGAIVDNNVKDLASGFKVGSAPPNGETAVRYTEKTNVSYLLFISNNFF